MEIIYHKGIKYSTKCPQCYQTIKFNINTDKFNISTICKNGHVFNEMSFSQFKKDCIEETNYSYLACNRCYSIINEEFSNFICENCNHIFCNNCINKHLIERKHTIRTNYIKKEKQCHIHQIDYNLFCEDCKENLCEKCKGKHKMHSIKSFIDIIPNNNDINSIKTYNEKIQLMIDKVTNYKNDFNKRYNNLLDLFNFLKNNINDKLLNKFNYSFFDYYNYDNFKYCKNYINNEEIFQNQNYLEYLIYGKYSNKKQSINNLVENKVNDIKYKENKEIYNTIFFENLLYFKDNLFINYELNSSKKIDLFEFKQDSFQYISTYSFAKLGKIDNLKPAKYNTDILINYYKKKNIQFLNFDSKEKTFSLSKNEIKAKKILHNDYFKECIDVKNGNIITTDLEEISLWKIHKNKIYGKIKFIKGDYSCLFNISDTIFGAQKSGFNNIIHFFSNDTFKFIKSLDIEDSFDIIGTIKNKLLCIQSHLNYNLIFIDINYLEIVLIKNYDDYFNEIKVLDNHILYFQFDNDVSKIQKESYDLNEGYFKDKSLIEKNINFSFYNEILVTDNNYIVVYGHDSLYVLKV